MATHGRIDFLGDGRKINLATVVKEREKKG